VQKRRTSTRWRAELSGGICGKKAIEKLHTSQSSKKMINRGGTGRAVKKPDSWASTTRVTWV
jgi:hypothetical protein